MSLKVGLYSYSKSSLGEALYGFPIPSTSYRGHTSRHNWQDPVSHRHFACWAWCILKLTDHQEQVASQDHLLDKMTVGIEVISCQWVSTHRCQETFLLFLISKQTQPFTRIVQCNQCLLLPAQEHVCAPEMRMDEALCSLLCDIHHPGSSKKLTIFV